MTLKKTIFLFLLCTSCASNQNIFPDLPTALDSAHIALPNPISVVADTANEQIILVNSNVDFFYENGSIITISVDATDPNAPVLTATDLVTTPRYAGTAAFDGAASLYVPFRENDQLIKYTVGTGTIDQTATGTVGKNPFGTAVHNGEVLVVSDKELNILDTDLNSLTDIDLTSASDSGVRKASTKYVENIAVDTTNDRAFISNRKGKIIIVDLDTNTLTHVVSDSTPNPGGTQEPLNTRGILFDDHFIYSTDGSPPSVFVFDADLVDDADPLEIDDADILVKLIDVELNPNGIVINTNTNRAFVANSSDKSISVIDLTLLEEIQRISLKEADTGFETGSQPFALATGAFNGGATELVLVANIDSNNITVINAGTLQVVASFP
ncbi:MAG: hypothetical protein A2048_02510 [Deltaproteobacteria bacterium GWA2_45_12]|nr:MAG: hypothetical protein A2048_02510 [Deltaproteobacteria bacterium GWA2_45_12]